MDVPEGEGDDDDIARLYQVVPEVKHDEPRRARWGGCPDPAINGVGPIGCPGLERLSERTV